MTSTLAGVSSEKIAALCRKHHIRRLALFGSVLRDDFSESSDLDILVEFVSNHVPGLRFFDIEQELAELFGCKVDLNTPGFLSPYFRDDVLAQAQDLYVAS